MGLVCIDGFQNTHFCKLEWRSSPSSPSTLIYVVPWSEFPIVPSYPHYPQVGSVLGDLGKLVPVVPRQHNLQQGVSSGGGEKDSFQKEIWEEPLLQDVYQVYYWMSAPGRRISRYKSGLVPPANITCSNQNVKISKRIKNFI